ncbi:hypothetical protein [Nostoc sp. PA-18-2419]|uniref:hypothetical protein n=1 Tax=Nostoc sp. PA-18-2419 TaxID=2575443 RepID=UPI001678860C|nr:hypothetical protein [Nostoc sp. PA-18-2419]
MSEVAFEEGTKHHQGFAGFRCRSTQPTIFLNPSLLSYNLYNQFYFLVEKLKNQVI